MSRISKKTALELDLPLTPGGRVHPSVNSYVMKWERARKRNELARCERRQRLLKPIVEADPALPLSRVQARETEKPASERRRHHYPIRYDETEGSKPYKSRKRK